VRKRRGFEAEYVNGLWHARDGEVGEVAHDHRLSDFLELFIAAVPL
jgi:hypothetical protein